MGHCARPWSGCVKQHTTLCAFGALPGVRAYRRAEMADAFVVCDLWVPASSLSVVSERADIPKL